eukprot:5572601-Alexandrium_andersonii.AAC.1
MCQSPSPAAKRTRWDQETRPRACSARAEQHRAGPPSTGRPFAASGQTGRSEGPQPVGCGPQHLRH